MSKLHFFWESKAMRHHSLCYATNDSFCLKFNGYGIYGVRSGVYWMGDSYKHLPKVFGFHIKLIKPYAR